MTFSEGDGGSIGQAYARLAATSRTLCGTLSVALLLSRAASLALHMVHTQLA